jgi:sugar lactone lactonase YvrE
MAMDAAGVIYMADGFESPANAKIERIDSTTGARTTIVGPDTPVVMDPTVGGGPWHILSPSALTWDRSNGLLFLDPINGRVLRLDLSTGVVRALCGSTRGDSGDGGPAVRARLNNPSALAVDKDGNIFVADFVANRIRRIDGRTGLISTVAGNGKPTRKVVL